MQAIDPRAFMMLFAATAAPENAVDDAATIVTIRGPISQHDDWWEDSYEAIRRRVDEACQQAAPVVVLRIDSPGGDVAGLFDTVRAIRETCKRAGKRLVAHVEGQACSAAYALATAAEWIVASRTAEVGSIGIVAARIDESRAIGNAGVDVTLIASGARKGDGWPTRPMSDDERAVFQADIDGLAQEFFDVVALRRGVSSQEIADLEAASFRGQAAVDNGLIDELGSFDHLMASLGAENPGDLMDDKEKEARDALTAIAEDEECSEEERERARRALAALDGDEEEEAENGDGDDAEDDDGDEGAEDEDDEEAKAAKASGTVSASTAASLVARGSDVEQRLAKLESRHDAEERDRLIEAHGGVPKGMAKLLASKPLAEVKAILAELPKPKKPKLGDAAATTTVAGTQGGDQSKASQLPPKEAKAMRKAMHMEKEEFGVIEKDNRVFLGAPKDGGES